VAWVDELAVAHVDHGSRAFWVVLGIVDLVGTLIVGAFWLRFRLSGNASKTARFGAATTGLACWGVFCLVRAATL